MKHIERINYLLGKYLDKTHNSMEESELFERLKEIRDPEMLDKIFQKGWVQSGDEDFGHLLSWQKLMKEVDRRSKDDIVFNKSRFSQFGKWSIAASILVIVAFIWWLIPDPIELQTYQTGFGETQDILLTDGTKVILNANSSLVWHLDLYEDQEGADYRLVELMGEAFFDVSHVDQEGRVLPEKGQDISRLVPFKVRTSDLTVNVLGTAFNVLSRRGKTDVYLENGSVQLELLDGQVTSTGKKGKLSQGTKFYETMMMEPGEMVSFSASTRSLHKIEAEDPDRFTEWKDGTLVFENVDFGLMLDRMEDIYGKEFSVQDTSLLNTPISAGLPYKDWDVVTKLLEATFDISLKEEQNNLVRVEKRKG